MQWSVKLVLLMAVLVILRITLACCVIENQGLSAITTGLLRMLLKAGTSPVEFHEFVDMLREFARRRDVGSGISRKFVWAILSL